MEAPFRFSESPSRLQVGRLSRKQCQALSEDHSDQPLLSGYLPMRAPPLSPVLKTDSGLYVRRFQILLQLL